mmetsp:Transcript_18204/g.27767  ORF Transcript_18204/g.27767 Transcript_18204/m.27767 type:complete len:214 (-) Transcript_18204:1119-1760(-)
MVVAPYKKEHQDMNHIHGASTIPTMQSKLKRYFVGISPKTKGESCFARVLIGHNKPLTEIMEDLTWWLKEQKTGIWERPLQAEETTVKGWFSYSHRFINQEVLSEYLQKELGVAIGLQYKVIFYGSKGTTNGDPVRALHLEVASEQATQVDPILAMLYSSTSNTYPAGIKMRLIPEYSQLLNMETREKLSIWSIDKKLLVLIYWALDHGRSKH